MTVCSLPVTTLLLLIAGISQMTNIEAKTLTFNTWCFARDRPPVFHFFKIFLLRLRLLPNTFQNALDTTESAPQGQGDAHFDAVSDFSTTRNRADEVGSGLDNAGKTTIVKKIMNEDVNNVSPTLGFIIKTIDYEG